MLHLEIEVIEPSFCPRLIISGSLYDYHVIRRTYSTVSVIVLCSFYSVSAIARIKN